MLNTDLPKRSSTNPMVRENPRFTHFLNTGNCAVELFGQSKMASVLNKPKEMGEKSTSKLTSMKLSDCNCPICMYILIEPVTMQCGHEMCMSCFKKNVQESSLTCPMCRVRISTWARKAAKNNTLINHERWRAIQEAFPDKVRNRLNGKEDDSSSDEGELVMLVDRATGHSRQLGDTVTHLFSGN